MRNQITRLLALCALLTCLSSASWASTYTQNLTASFGTALTGQAANVRVTVYDQSGTIQIAATNAPVVATVAQTIAESTDAAGTANTGVYVTRATIDTSWLPIHVKWTIVGQAGVTASAIIGTDRAAALADGYTAARGANLSNLDVASSTLATAAAQTTNATNVGTLLTRIPGVVQPQTGDAYARIGAAGAGLTAIGDTRLANLDAAISTRMATFTLPTNFSSLGISVGGLVGLTAAEHTLIGATDVPIGLNTAAPGSITTGSAYAKLNAASSAGDPWATLLTSETATGSFGAFVKTLHVAANPVVLPTTPPTGYGNLGNFYAPVADVVNGSTTPSLVITLTKNGANQPVVTWTADSLATGYKVLRSTNGVNYSVIGTTTNLTYTDTARPVGTVYYSIIANH